MRRTGGVTGGTDNFRESDFSLPIQLNEAMWTKKPDTDNVLT